MLSEKRKKEIQKKVEDKSIRCQLLVNLTKTISTKHLHKYKLVEKTKALLITKRHLFRNNPIYSCPNCEEGVIHYLDFFCPNCGAKLKFSKGITD